MCYSLSVRQILFASNAIKTIDDEESYLIVYCLNCILHDLMCIPGFMLAIGCIVRSSFYKACGTRRISFASNATPNNEMGHYLLFKLRSIRPKCDV